MGVDTVKPIKIDRKSNRCFEFLVTAQAALAGWLLGRVGSPFDRPSVISQTCYVPPVEVELDAAAVLNAISAATWPTFITIGFHGRAERPASAPPLNAVQRILGSAYEHAFLSYFENIRDEIEAKYGDKVLRWPAEIQFGRVVRNAFGHGGKITWTKPPLVPVSWRGLTYSPAHQGQQVVYNDLSQGDLTILMLDIDQLL